MHAVAKMANLTEFCQGFWRKRQMWGIGQNWPCSGENGKFDKILSKLLAKVANMANLVKLANLAKLWEMFSQMQMSLLEGPW